MTKKRKRASAASRKPASDIPNIPRLPRVARGKRPQYFSDPAIDKLLSITLTLCEELSVTRDRLDTVERLLEKRNLVKRAAIEKFAPDAKSAAEREARRRSYVDRVMHAVHAQLSEISGNPPRSPEDAVAAVDDLPR